MAKTLAQLVADTRKIIGQTSAANSNFTDTEITGFLNDAYTRVATDLRYLPPAQHDYTAASQITLNAATVTVDRARIKDPGNGNKYKPLEVITLDKLIRDIDSDYENAATGVPDYLAAFSMASGQLTVIPYPPPSAAVIALTTPLRCNGYDVPTAMSLNTDIPNLPPNIHDILPNYAAFRCFQALNDDPRSVTQITLYRSGLKAQRSISIEFSSQTKRFDFSERADF